MKTIKSTFFVLCPKTGRIVGVKSIKQQPFWLFPIIGLAALIWFLVRVIPKPSRASYPCQRVAFPLAVGFVSWLLGSIASTAVLRKVKLSSITKRLVNVVLCFIIGILVLGGGSTGAQAFSPQSYTPHTPNAPIGVARGLEPGRVVWVHDPAVTDWAGQNSGTRWWDHIDQSVASDMMSWAIRGYANQTSVAAAWDAIFSNFNGGTGYQPGEKILIKINMVTTWDNGTNYDQAEGNGRYLYSIANSPQVLVALLGQLINSVGVAQTDITVTDPTGLFVNYLYTPLHSAFPNVHYEDSRGTLGRSKAQYTSPCVPFYWSTSDANGKTQDCVVQSYYNAKYIINYGNLKTHALAGITATFKNNYGSLLRTPNASGYYNLHDRLPLQPTNTNWHNMGYYRPMVDEMGSKYIGGKTVLFLVDGIFGGKDWNGVPSKWSMAPFNGNWPASLFVSMDPVAIDSVAFDFLSQQWPDHALAYEGVQDYLHEAALAPNSPSGTCYDPELDGVCMSSLGVHEHWNNATDKQYSRNLSTGNGIELLYVNSDPDIPVTPTKTTTSAPSATATASRTPTSSRTTTFTRSSTPTKTPTITPTQTYTPSSTPTKTPTNTPTQTYTPSSTPTFTPTNTVTFTPTQTTLPTDTPTGIASYTPSDTAARTPTWTASFTPTTTSTYTTTATFAPSGTPTRSSTPTQSRTPTRTNSPTATRTRTNTPTASRTLTVTFTRTNTPTGTITPQSANFLTNGDMENGTTGWTVFGSGTLSSDTSLFHGGARSLKISGRTAAWNGLSQVITGLTSGQSYTVKVWVRSQTGTPTAKATLQLTAGSTTYISLASAAVTSTGWTQLSGNATVSWSGTLTQARFYVETAAGTDNFYIDDAQLSH